jgi:hypothetical protein
VAVPAGDATPGQFDLLSWKPKAPPSATSAPPAAPSNRLPEGQLDLFGLDFDPEPKN